MSHTVILKRPFRSECPSAFGFSPFYKRNVINHCPGCGQAQWYIGRVSAECAFCATALPLQEAVTGESRMARPPSFEGASTA